MKEARALRSEWEGGPEEGDSRLTDLRAECEGVEEALWRREEESWREGVLRRFGEVLEREPELGAIFRCLCDGLNQSKEIARRLGIEEAAVVRGRKKLARRSGEFRRRLKTDKTEG